MFRTRIALAKIQEILTRSKTRYISIFLLQRKTSTFSERLWSRVVLKHFAGLLALTNFVTELDEVGKAIRICSAFLKLFLPGFEPHSGRPETRTKMWAAIRPWPLNPKDDTILSLFRGTVLRFPPFASLWPFWPLSDLSDLSLLRELTFI